jgi:uncharacterized protein YndB with AHSA1/START domain
MFKKIAIAVVVMIGVLIALLLALAATKPDTFRVERSASIKAPPEKIFPAINDLRAWGAWSPYEKKDATMKRMYSGAASGKGAMYEWDGDKNVGRGRMTITESTPPSRVVIALDFIKPFETHNTAEVTLVPQGDSTKVTWAMQGPVPYVAKIMHVLFDMDRMVGDDFAAGLANLKAIAEKAN